MTLFTSISATVQFLVLDRIPWDYGLALFLVGAAASIFGQLVILGYAKRSGKNSLLVFATAFIIIVSAILLCVTGALNIKEDVDSGKSLGFRPLCD